MIKKVLLENLTFCECSSKYKCVKKHLLMIKLKEQSLIWFSIKPSSNISLVMYKKHLIYFPWVKNHLVEFLTRFVVNFLSLVTSLFEVQIEVWMQIWARPGCRKSDGLTVSIDEYEPILNRLYMYMIKCLKCFMPKSF